MKMEIQRRMSNTYILSEDCKEWVLWDGSLEKYAILASVQKNVNLWIWSISITQNERDILGKYINLIQLSGNKRLLVDAKIEAIKNLEKMQKLLRW